MQIITASQRNYIAALAKQNGFDSALDAAQDYGFSTVDGLSMRQASELIDWLKNGKSVINAEERAAMAAAEAGRAEKERAAAAYAEKQDADRLALEERTRKTNEELDRRGLGHLTGKSRSDARYQIQKELGI
jgi:ribose 1,5-bisphosphokinase PhnN